MHVVGVEGAVLDRVGGVADLLEIALRELIGVDDEVCPAGQVLEIGLERSRVHRDEHIGRVARSHDVVVSEVQLERRDTRQGPGRCPDLGREVGQRREIVSETCCLRGEAITGELHAVTGVAGEANDNPAEFHDLLGHVDTFSARSWGLHGLRRMRSGRY